jgi:hypothetical protein
VWDGWQRENARRRWNYIPFIMAALTALATRGRLAGLLEAGKKKQAEARERAVREAMEKRKAAAGGGGGGR